MVLSPAILTVSTFMDTDGGDAQLEAMILSRPDLLATELSW